MAVIMEKVCFSYGAKDILRNFSLALPERGILCLFGPSGCGKTTVMRLLAGLEHPSSGRITGREKLKQGVVFQENRLLPWRTASENVALACSAPEVERTARLWLERLGLAGQADAFPASLSGGMKRRVAIARALAGNPDMLLLDEPFTGLDEQIREKAAGYIRDFAREKPVLLITHIEEEWQTLGAACIRLREPPLTGEYQA